ncbi:hypothetical protein O3M35_010589 [Rhynocoris fuscipes]|uniref:Chitin-binding type-2 domain-containing protein n=1 Tax=Rhynocoris fuscipes TaxID=488301 RepID=A0AAW1D6J7_9HEMI
MCVVNCTISADTLIPDCSKSSPNCCSPDPMNCFSFYTCDESNKLHLTFCGPLQSYNAKTLHCEQSEIENVCYPKCAKRCRTNDNGDAICNKNESCCLPNPDNCKYFTTCSNNRTDIGQCSVDSEFDDIQLSCLPGIQKCYQNDQECKRACPKNQVICTYDCCGPEVGACSEQYYRCIKGVKISEFCPSLTRFNMTTLKCDASAYFECNFIMTNFTECAPPPNNPSCSKIKPQSSTNERRELLSKEQLLTLFYSAYKNLTELLTASESQSQIINNLGST